MAAAKRVCRQMADTFRPSWTDLDGAQAQADNQNPFESEMSEINMTLAAPRAAHSHTHTQGEGQMSRLLNGFKIMRVLAAGCGYSFDFVRCEFLNNFGMRAKYVLLLNCCLARL